ncbi:MAG: hypothetical protein ACRD1Y_08845 [Terriglobales bacterium]
MSCLHRRILPLWAAVVAYGATIAVRWAALPHNLVVRFSAMDAPLRFLPRLAFVPLTLAILCILIAVLTRLLPREGELGRGAVTLSFGCCYGITGFVGGVFWSLVRVNAGLGSPVRPAVAAALAFTAVGLVMGVSAPAPLPLPSRQP